MARCESIDLTPQQTTGHHDMRLFNTLHTRLKVRRYAPVLYTGTSLVGLKSYRHFFVADCHTGMKIIKTVASRCVS